MGKIKSATTENAGELLAISIAMRKRRYEAGSYPEPVGGLGCSTSFCVRK
jgi:hypothetical protein